MKKADFPPLLPPGIHELTLAELQAIAVTPFLADAKRALLFASFQQWLQKLQSFHVEAILWIDGSFLTSKPSPADIDCIMWDPETSVSLTSAQWNEVRKLTDRNVARVQFGLDLYMEKPAPEKRLHRQAYFRGLFGFQHDEKTPKGFVELKI
ncbi:hypothetical protein GTP58_11615 [Duganella sp. CY15W]|uniref:DUF6932 family protein n=1 Tax=Duganella sp. CY15W TaxID=2692172 RepID=UPI00136D70C3|nr:hypothetical protein [Duganella sp. CY15W]MYM28967.1 hypothetical protein [Duganella sp. CY15W]